MRSKTCHLLFLDECGTHDMGNIDPAFPVFVLAGLLVGEKYYAKTLVPRVKQLKLDNRLSPETVLQSRKIRKCEDAFQFLQTSPERRSKLYSSINNLFAGLRIRLFAVIIDKRRLRSRFLVPLNPYYVSLSQLLSMVCGMPGMPGSWRPFVSRFVAESRGKREDKELQAEYQSLRTSGIWCYRSTDVFNRRASTVRRLFPDRVDFVKKTKVVGGLELTDLAAYPIARAAVNQR